MPLSSDEVHPQQRRLAARLKELRRDAGLSAAGLGASLGWSQSKASKMENGQTSLTIDDIERWLGQCGVDEATRGEILDLAAGIGTRVRPWRGEVNRAAYDDQQRARATRDAETNSIAVFQSEVVPGLLQTPEYARRLLEVHSLVPPEEVGSTVLARLDRQAAVLFDETKQIELVMTETALRWRPGSVGLALAQLDRIASLASLPSVSIGVISRQAQETALPLHSFVILQYPDDPAVVQVETLTAEQEVTEPADVELYQEFFKQQRSYAVYGDELTGLLDRLRDDLQSSTPPP